MTLLEWSPLKAESETWGAGDLLGRWSLKRSKLKKKRSKWGDGAQDGINVSIRAQMGQLLDTRNRKFYNIFSQILYSHNPIGGMHKFHEPQSILLGDRGTGCWGVQPSTIMARDPEISRNVGM